MAQQSTETSPIVKMAGVGIIAIGLFYGVQSLKDLSQQINNLPVAGTNANNMDPMLGVKSKAPEVNAIHPLIVESQAKTAGQVEQSSGVTSFEKLFQDTNQSQSLVAPEFDFRTLKGSVVVGALMDNGAIINNKFYVPGDKIASLGYQPTMDSPIKYPVLKSVGKTFVVISNGQKRHPVTFKVSIQ